MKTTKLLSLAITALVALASTAWAVPNGGGGGGHFVGGGYVGGGFRGGGFGGGHFGGGQFGSTRFGGYSGTIRAGPAFSGGVARFSGNRSIAALSQTPQQFY